MAQNYRTRKITNRITPISSKQMQNLRNNRLAKAKSAAERRFLSSQSFDREVRSQIRLNRREQNIRTLARVSKQIGGSSDEQRVVRQLFGEKTRTIQGKVRRTNTFTSYSQTKRLKKIESQLKAGTFNVSRVVKSTKKFQEIKRYVPSNASQGELLTSIQRDEFYFENQPLIKRYNKLAQRNGRVHADNLKTGQKLANAYTEYTNEDNIILSLVEK